MQRQQVRALILHQRSTERLGLSQRSCSRGRELLLEREHEVIVICEVGVASNGNVPYPGNG